MPCLKYLFYIAFTVYKSDNLFLIVCKPTSEDTMEGYYISGSPICWRNRYAHCGKFDCEWTH